MPPGFQNRLIIHNCNGSVTRQRDQRRSRVGHGVVTEYGPTWTCGPRGRFSVFGVGAIRMVCSRSWHSSGREGREGDAELMTYADRLARSNAEA